MFCAACVRAIKAGVKKGPPNNATQKHHKLHNKKPWNILYKDCINDEINKEPACAACNVGHASPFLTHWNELQFCEAKGIKPRSKKYQFITSQN